MDILKYISLMAVSVLTVTVMASCSSSKKAEEPVEDIPITEEESAESETQEIEADSYPSYPIKADAVEESEFSELLEAEYEYYEDENLYGNYIIEGYSGSGYIEGFDGKGEFSFTVELPTSQHYDISLVIASESRVKCGLKVNGKEVKKFETDDSGEFKKITLSGVYLESGTAEIGVVPEKNVALDCMQVVNSTAISEITYNPELLETDVNSGQSARRLMEFLTANYGKRVITGQYAENEDNSELDLIYKITGKYPAIRFAVLDNDSKSGDCKDINASLDWYERGGIVGAMWQWRSPSEKSSVYAKESDFDIKKAVTNYDIAGMTKEELKGLLESGYITEECYKLIGDIDVISEKLLILKSKGVPVIWRPLHEASLADKSGKGVYWWGAGGEDSYRWLWNLMYRRMTHYHGLDNLIWVWNGMSEGWTVDKSTYSIASYDIYTGSGEDYGSRYEQFASAQKYIGSDKILAISECDHIPDIDDIFRDKSVWSFFGLWYGEYLEDGKGNYSEKYTKKKELIRLYNSEGALTLDEVSY